MCSSQFNSGLPDGFTPLRSIAQKYGIGLGVWLSPWGGYEEEKKQRIAYGEEHGYETHQREFDSAAQATKALSKAGIGRDRCGPIPEDADADWSCTFEMSHNEAQKLDVLHVDSTE